MCTIVLIAQSALEGTPESIGSQLDPIGAAQCWKIKIRTCMILVGNKNFFWGGDIGADSWLARGIPAAGQRVLTSFAPRRKQKSDFSVGFAQNS